MRRELTDTTYSYFQKYDQTTQKAYQQQQRHNKLIKGDNDIFFRADAPAFQNAYNYAHDPRNFEEGAGFPPQYPSQYATSGPSDINTGPEIRIDTRTSTRPVRLDPWMSRQENLGPDTQADPYTGVTPPDGSYYHDSGSSHQYSNNPSEPVSRQQTHSAQPPSRQPSVVVPVTGVPTQQFEGTGESVQFHQGIINHTQYYEETSEPIQDQQLDGMIDHTQYPAEVIVPMQPFDEVEDPPLQNLERRNNVNRRDGACRSGGRRSEGPRRRETVRDRQPDDRPRRQPTQEPSSRRRKGHRHRAHEQETGCNCGCQVM